MLWLCCLRGKIRVIAGLIKGSLPLQSRWVWLKLFGSLISMDFISVLSLLLMTGLTPWHEFLVVMHVGSFCNSPAHKKGEAKRTHFLTSLLTKPGVKAPLNKVLLEISTLLIDTRPWVTSCVTSCVQTRQQGLLYDHTQPCRRSGGEITAPRFALKLWNSSGGLDFNPSVLHHPLVLETTLWKPLQQRAGVKQEVCKHH